MNRLLDRNAMVTGAAQGMGLTIAKSLYRKGARVFLLDINDAAAAAAAKEMDPSGTRSVGRRGDVTSRGDVQAIVGEI